MIKRVAALAAAGLLLAACGSVSSATAMANWVRQSSYVSTSKALIVDAAHSATALRRAATSSNDLHTVCGVLDEESEQANSSLPTPDNQATSLLSRAYDALGDGANLCYNAGTDAATRAKALAYFSRAVADLSEASARVASASTP